MPREKFGTAISCIDGRAHPPLIAWMRNMLSVDYVDLITYAGADGFVASDPAAAERLLKAAVEISVQRHRSPVLALAGHHDCAANPASAEAHRDQLLHGLRVLESWNLGVKLIGIWVNSEWQVEVVRTRGAQSAPP